MTLGDAEQDRSRAEVSIGHQAIAGLDVGEQVGREAPLLGVAVLAGDRRSDEHDVGLQDGQTQAGKRPGGASPEHAEPTLGVGQVSTVDDLEAIAGKDGRASAACRLDQRAGLAGGVLDERGRDGRLGGVELVVEGRAGDRERCAEGEDPGVDRGHRSRDDRHHDVDDRREVQGLVVLRLPRHLEDGVDLGGCEGVLQAQADREGDRRMRLVAVENLLNERGKRGDRAHRAPERRQRELPRIPARPRRGKTRHTGTSNPR
nr:hypothetical protein [Deltaproteobacteria bacterium]